MKNIGIIGLGVMATRMIANVINYGGFRVAAAWDPSPATLIKVRELAPDLKIMKNAEELITDAEVDGVYIASPPVSHAPYATAVIEAGKPVLSEKPLGVDLEQSRKLVQLAENSRISNAVNFTFATSLAADEMKSALRNKIIGEVSAVDIHLHFCKWPRDWQVPATLLTQREQGGFVRETVSHYAYLAEKLFGPIKLIKAWVRYPEDQHAAEIQAMALMDCNGIPIKFSGGTGGLDTSAADQIEFTVWGKKAVYQIYDWNKLRSNRGDGWVEHLTDIVDTRQAGYRQQVGAIGSFFDGDSHPLPDFNLALRVQELIEEILKKPV